jgi:hypothetical protein
MSMAETVELHGGKLHGQTYPTPLEPEDVIEVEVKFLVDGQFLKRIGTYTRVHSIDGRPLKLYEFSGYHTPFLPIDPAPKEISND